MQEKAKIQAIPVKVYRTAERLMVAAPMPGLEPENILVTVSTSGQLVLEGEPRGSLKGFPDKELLIDEWSVGGYYRKLELPDMVDGEHANVNYGNGVLVIAFPLSEQGVAATLTLDKTGVDRGEYMGNSGHE
jgi:HSP20 family protein